MKSFAVTKSLLAPGNYTCVMDGAAVKPLNKNSFPSFRVEEDSLQFVLSVP